ncbi:hypothetical protein KX730_23250, partial [Escherichia coli]|uniref:hypothetical protein n=1 Tax=Escherichia coli TaxID=562 RepID=UPI001C52B09D
TDGDGSHGSTSKTPSYTKSVSWHHYRKRLALKSLNYKHIQLCKGGYNKPDYFNVCIPALLISQNNKNPG